MARMSKYWISILIMAAVLVAVASLLVGIVQKNTSMRGSNANLSAENDYLKVEHERLQNRIAYLNRQNLSLKKYLDVYENHFAALNDAAGTRYRLKAMLPAELPPGLGREKASVQQAYLRMLAEKKRWDRYQKAQYRGILEGRLEPNAADIPELDLVYPENGAYLDELAAALNLHRRLIRDVRLFHDEVRYRDRQRDAGDDYEMYDLKLTLAPFARESALVDAMQQAMSALSAGIYQDEAVAVLERIGDAFTQPIQKLFERRKDTDGKPSGIVFNYTLYPVYGKKLLDYADALTRQSAIALGPSAFGELDYFNRWLSDNLHTLYQLSQETGLDASRLNLDELGRVLENR